MVDKDFVYSYIPFNPGRHLSKKKNKKKNPYDLVKLLVLRIFEGKIEMCPILLIICGSIDRMI